MNNQVNRIPQIVMTHDVARKISAYTDLCPYEISALGDIIIDNDTQDIVIKDIHLLDQEVTGASTTIAPLAVSNLILERVKSGKDPSTLKFWWHSHVNMDVFWSGTDRDTIEGFSTDWMISIVTNKSGKHKVRLDVFKPIRITYDDMPVVIEYDKSVNPVIQKEIEQKVRMGFIAGVIHSVSQPLSKAPSKIPTHDELYRRGVNNEYKTPVTHAPVSAEPLPGNVGQSTIGMQPIEETPQIDDPKPVIPRVITIPDTPAVKNQLDPKPLEPITTVSVKDEKISTIPPLKKNFIDRAIDRVIYNITRKK